MKLAVIPTTSNVLLLILLVLGCNVAADDKNGNNPSLYFQKGYKNRDSIDIMEYLKVSPTDRAFNISCTFSPTDDALFFLEVHYSNNKDNGAIWQNHQNSLSGFGTNVSVHKLNAKLTIESINFLASYSQTNTEKRNIIYFDDHSYSNDKDYSSYLVSVRKPINFFHSVF